MITSTSNNKIKHVSMLLTNSKLRKQEGLFVVEGERMVREIPSDRIVECFVSEDFSGIDTLLPETDYEVVSSQVFKKMSGTMTPQGVLCVVKAQKVLADDFIKDYLGKPLRLLILEGVQDPGNLGTMIRTAEGAGFDAIIADSKTVDVYNPKVTRSTMGSLFRVPVIYTEDLEEILDILLENGITVCAAHLKGTHDYSDATYTDKCAVLIGNEGNGLSDRISSKANLLVKIPMSGEVESLNAAVAAALMMYEVRRQNS